MLALGLAASCARQWASISSSEGSSTPVARSISRHSLVNGLQSSTCTMPPIERNIGTPLIERGPALSSSSHTAPTSE